MDRFLDGSELCVRRSSSASKALNDYYRDIKPNPYTKSYVYPKAGFEAGPSEFVRNELMLQGDDILLNEKGSHSRTGSEVSSKISH